MDSRRPDCRKWKRHTSICICQMPSRDRATLNSGRPWAYSDLSVLFVVPFLQPAEEKPHGSFLSPFPLQAPCSSGWWQRWHDDNGTYWALLIYICSCVCVCVCVCIAVTIFISKLRSKELHSTLKHVENREGGRNDGYGSSQPDFRLLMVG